MIAPLRLSQVTAPGMYLHLSPDWQLSGEAILYKFDPTTKWQSHLDVKSNFEEDEDMFIGPLDASGCIDLRMKGDNGKD